MISERLENLFQSQHPFLEGQTKVNLAEAQL